MQPSPQTRTKTIDPLPSVSVNESTRREFVRFACADLGEDCRVLSFLPLSASLTNEFPERTLTPPPGGTLLDEMSVARLVESRQIVVGVSILGDAQEREAAGKILKQLRGFASVTVFVVLLLPGGMDPDAAASEDAKLRFQQMILSQHDELLQNGAQDIILNPAMTRGSLKNSLCLMAKTNEKQIVRMEEALAREPPGRQQREVDELEQTRQRLLWHSIPRKLMPDFPLYDKTVKEDTRGIGPYLYERRWECDMGEVLLAQTVDKTPVAVKVISKSEITSPDELESLYREFKFISQLNHPNITKCIDAVQTASSFYMIMEYGGGGNLEQYCIGRPGARLAEEIARDCFAQVVSALACLHNRGIAHRCVSHHHVAVMPLRQDRLKCTLLDFRNAVLVNDDSLSQKVCGWLPYIPPEMVTMTAGYVPRFADAWSVGVLLLEIAGGIGSLAASAYNGIDEDSPECAVRIINFFNSPNSHQQALGRLDGVNCPEILRSLRELIRMPPDSRRSLPDLLNSLTVEYE